MPGWRSLPEVLLAPEFIPLHDAGVTSVDVQRLPTAFEPQPEPLAGPWARPCPDRRVPEPAARPDRRPGRAELREERRQARRQQLRLSFLGLSVLVVTLAATVAVLDVTR